MVVVAEESINRAAGLSAAASASARLFRALTELPVGQLRLAFKPSRTQQTIRSNMYNCNNARETPPPSIRLCVSGDVVEHIRLVLRTAHVFAVDQAPDRLWRRKGRCQ